MDTQLHFCHDRFVFLYRRGLTFESGLRATLTMLKKSGADGLRSQKSGVHIELQLANRSVTILEGKMIQTGDREKMTENKRDNIQNKNRLSAWNTAAAYAPCADRISCARLRADHE